MDIKTGIDLIEIFRIQDMLVKLKRAKERIYTKKEIEYCENRGAGRYSSYAARFAAKEAVSKAFGTGIGRGISFKDIEVANNEAGKPYIILHNGAEDFFKEEKGIGLEISLTHSKTMAAASVIFIKE